MAVQVKDLWWVEKRRAWSRAIPYKAPIKKSTEDDRIYTAIIFPRKRTGNCPQPDQKDL